MAWAIKWREARPEGRARRPWWFLTANGGGNRLKVHAATWPNAVAADRACARLAGDNPATEFRVVDLDAEEGSSVT